MSIADPSERARIAARGRWGNQVVSRAAGVVIERAAELDDATADAVAQAVTGLRAPAGVMITPDGVLDLQASHLGAAVPDERRGGVT